MTSKRARKRSRQKVPDLIMALNSNHQIQVVGELKTPWTFTKPKRISQAAFLASKFGQVARYMDLHRCRYGLFSTYNETWFLRRRDDGYHVEASQAVHWGAYATPRGVSARECFAFLALMAIDEGEARLPFAYGAELTRKGYRPPRMVTEKHDTCESSDEEKAEKHNPMEID
ncbi:hypothetical protein HFD88_004160 [Aspergillus terreus]|nr:hypothetical protein HFD88_004160 [Aspergillus terreus]